MRVNWFVLLEHNMQEDYNDGVKFREISLQTFAVVDDQPVSCTEAQTSFTSFNFE